MVLPACAGRVFAKKEPVWPVVPVGARLTVAPAKPASATSISQKAALAALTGPQHSVTEMLSEYRRRRDQVWQWLTEDERFTRVVNEGTVAALPQLDHTVKIDAVGLEPGCTYYYRFAALGSESHTGRTRTTPLEHMPRARFAIAS